MNDKDEVLIFLFHIQAVEGYFESQNFLGNLQRHQIIEQYSVDAYLQ